ncbi:hypothetical protein ABIC83_002624 [Roseateles asaccharophilus]|uniref:hypothetical protein n=1 Tax=Roseateles asaccharophilus TaxID=582607 RepID=UPI0038381F95
MIDPVRQGLGMEAIQARAYDGLNACRHAVGVSRLVMGVHLATLMDTDGWIGRTGAKSFRRFLQEEGIEPRAAYQYMAVARAFIMTHQVDPRGQIAMVSMRVLADALPHLKGVFGDEENPSNVADVLAVVTSLPPAEARAALFERFGPPEAPLDTPDKVRISAPVTQILGKVDGLTHEQRSELFSTLRLSGTRPAAIAPAQ